MSQITKSRIEEKIDILNKKYGFDITIVGLGENKYILKMVKNEITIGHGTLFQINYFLDGIQQGLVIGSNPVYNSKKMEGPVYPDKNFPVGLNMDKSSELQEINERVDKKALNIEAANAFEKYVRQNRVFFIKARAISSRYDKAFEFTYNFHILLLDLKDRQLSVECSLMVKYKDRIYGNIKPFKFNIWFEFEYANMTSLEDYMYFLVKHSSDTIGRLGYDYNYQLWTPYTKKEDLIISWSKKD